MPSLLSPRHHFKKERPALYESLTPSSLDHKATHSPSLLVRLIRCLDHLAPISLKGIHFAMDLLLIAHFSPAKSSSSMYFYKLASSSSSSARSSASNSMSFS